MDVAGSSRSMGDVVVVVVVVVAVVGGGGDGIVVEDVASMDNNFFHDLDNSNLDGINKYVLLLFVLFICVMISMFWSL